jgi:hypothetical protein
LVFGAVFLGATVLGVAVFFAATFLGFSSLVSDSSFSTESVFSSFSALTKLAKSTIPTKALYQVKNFLIKEAKLSIEERKIIK